MQLSLKYFYYIPLIAAALISIYRTLKKKGGNFYLTIILILSFVVEITAYILNQLGNYTLWLYNIFQIFEITLYLQVLKQFSDSSKAKKVYSIFQVVYTILSLVNIFFVQGLYTYNTMSYAVGCFLMIIGCLYSFSEIIRFKKDIVLKTAPSFWITVGLLFFYFVSFPYYVTINFQIQIFQAQSTFILVQILHLINFIFYTIFCIGLLCNVKKTNIS